MEAFPAKVLLLLIAALAVSLSSAKTVTGTFLLEAGDFEKGPEEELTKYSFAVGDSKVTGIFEYTDAKTWMTSPALYLFKDDKWAEYHAAPACQEKVALAHASIPIGRVTSSHTHLLNEGLGRATEANTEELEDGKVRWTFTWEISHHVRTYGWFLIAADCALEQYNARVTPMTYTIELYNPGNTHLPADEHGLPRVYFYCFAVMLAYAVFCCYLAKKHYDETGKIHLVVWLLAVAYLLQLLSIFCELLHLWRYKHDGVGIYLFDLISEVAEGASQSAISFVLTALACGWTLIDSDADRARGNSVANLLRNPKKLFRGPNVAVVVIITLVILSMILSVLNKGYDGDFQKFHDHESAPGKLLVLLRLLLGLAFCYSLHVTLKVQTRRGGNELIAFLRRLMLLGGLWFLAFPVLVFASSIFAHYLRHRIVTGGVLLLQVSSLSLLAYQFLAHSSSYFKISTLSESGVLPGAGGYLRPQKAAKD